MKLYLKTVIALSGLLWGAANATKCNELYLNIKRPHTELLGQRASLRVDRVADEFRRLAIRYPDRITISSYGTVEGEDLMKVRVVPLKPDNPLTVGMSAGLHGNEVLGPISILNLVQSLMLDPKFADRIDLTLYPMTNPRALKKAQRKLNNDPKLDLNRIFKRDSDSPEVVALAKELDGKNFMIGLDLHGGPTKFQFFVIGAKDDGGLAKDSLAKLPQDILLESHSKTYPGRAGIPSDPDRYAMEARGVARSALPLTLKDFMSSELKIPYVYTLEYPGRMDPASALRQNQELIESFLKTLLERRSAKP